MSAFVEVLIVVFVASFLGTYAAVLSMKILEFVEKKLRG